MTPNGPARHDRIVEDKVIAPGGHWSGIVKRGQVLRLVDLEGRQAIDFLCYNAADPSERYNAADTMKIGGSLFVGMGTKLYSDMGNVLFTVIDDTCGRHDTIGGCCSRESNRVRYGASMQHCSLFGVSKFPASSLGNWPRTCV